MSDKIQRFTENARHVFSLAEVEAKRHKRETITTEYLLMGLLRDEDGIAGRILRELGLNVKKVESLVKRKSRAGRRDSPAKLDLSPGTKRVIELAVSIARELGYPVVDTEYLLLALVSQNEDGANGILSALKITPEQVWQQARPVMQAGQPAPPQPVGRRKPQLVTVCMEDDPAMLDLVSLILKSRGLEVFGAASGSEGLELIAAHKPDLVLLDPKTVAGWELYQRMKADVGMRAIPIVRMPAKGQNIEEELTKSIGKVQAKGDHNDEQAHIDLTTLMLVEDDSAIRDVIEMMCELWGLTVLAFRDGFQAMDYLKNENLSAPLPQVALLDIRMPGPWGHEIGARIRQHPQLKNIGIILMTGFELPGEDEKKYLQSSGADKLVFKPLPPMDILLESIRSAVREFAGARRVEPSTCQP